MIYYKIANLNDKIFKSLLGYALQLARNSKKELILLSNTIDSFANNSMIKRVLGLDIIKSLKDKKNTNINGIPSLLFTMKTYDVYSVDGILLLIYPSKQLVEKISSISSEITIICLLDLEMDIECFQGLENSLYTEITF